MRKAKYNFSLQDYIEDLKRTRLSDYCLSECQNNCCMKLAALRLDVDEGQLFFLYEDELRRQYSEKAKFERGMQSLFDSKKSDLISKGMLYKKSNDSFEYLGFKCPRFENSTKYCQIHEDTRRPKGCMNFPIYFEKNVLEVDLRCDFTRKNVKGIMSGLDDTTIENIKKNRIFLRFTIPLE